MARLFSGWEAHSGAVYARSEKHENKNGVNVRRTTDYNQLQLDQAAESTAPVPFPPKTL